MAPAYTLARAAWRVHAVRGSVLPNAMMKKRHDWFRSFVLHGSVLPRIWVRVVVFTLVAVGETFANKWGWISFDLSWSTTAVMGSAVGLLIAFRTNSGYERFWEARTAWGAILNRTRNLARQVETLLEPAAKREAVLLMIAFAHGAKRHFWHDSGVVEADVLLGRERSLALQAPPGMPQRALLELGKLFQRARENGKMDSVDQSRLEEDVTVLIDQFGICQRIRSTPLPRAYVIQLRTALTLFLCAVPLSSGVAMGWVGPALVFVIAYVFLGMEQIGTELEDPFEHTENDVRLEEIAQKVEDDLLALCDVKVVDGATGAVKPAQRDGMPAVKMDEETHDRAALR